jgi:pimeloyl-ACP methyl ester carboxylesterase
MKIILLHGIIGSKSIFDYFKKEFCRCYDIEAIDLVGYGDEAKPNINYDVKDFLDYIDRRTGISKAVGTKFILIGYSLGALLAKELAIKYPSKVIKVFVVGYPWLKPNVAYKKRSALDRAYIDGRWWAKLICDTKAIHKWLLFPFVLVTAPKYLKPFLDSYNHTYISASRTIHNTILKDNKEDLRKLSEKVFLINGEKDKNADLKFAEQFNHYVVKGMGHGFFGHEKKIAEIIKLNITEACLCPPASSSR